MIPHKGQDLVRDFQAGMTVSVHYELGEKLAAFQAKVVESQEDNSPPTLVLAQPKQVEWKDKTGQEIQRRNFVRLEEALTIVYSPTRGIFREGTSIDISGNGLSMVIDLQLDLGKLITLTIPLPQKKISCTGKIVRCSAYGKGARSKFEVGVHFQNLEPANQDIIVRHIFERQRDLRRRGLL